MNFRLKILTAILLLFQFNLLAANFEKNDKDVVYYTEKGFISTDCGSCHYSIYHLCALVKIPKKRS